MQCMKKDVVSEVVDVAAAFAQKGSTGQAFRYRPGLRPGATTLISLLEVKHSLA